MCFTDSVANCVVKKKNISALKAENRQLKMGISNHESSLNENQKIDVHYITDEDDLATETEWIIKKRPSKKRKA